MLGKYRYIAPDAVGSPGPMQHDLLERHTMLKRAGSTRFTKKMKVKGEGTLSTVATFFRCLRATESVSGT